MKISGIATTVGFYLLLSVVTSCRNPFIWDVPPDIHSDALRATPQGVLEQIIASYEGRQIDLYEDLFPKDGSFRFFVAPAFLDSNFEKYKQFREVRDTRLQFIGQSEYYYYWAQEQEFESHTRLFSRANSIEFVEKPLVESVRKFVDHGDSLAEMLITGGWLEVGVDIDVHTIEVSYTTIQRQVLLLEKDEDDLWVISKWYDFSSNGN